MKNSDGEKLSQKDLAVIELERILTERERKIRGSDESILDAIEIEPIRRLLESQVNPINLFILESLNEGIPKSTIHERIREIFGIKISGYKVSQRIKRLKEKGILLQERTIIVDPTKLYDHFYMALIKIDLTSPLSIGVNARPWKTAYDRILDLNAKYGSPIKILLHATNIKSSSVFGALGDFDFVAFIYVNDQEKYHEFKEELFRTGIIKNIDTKYADVPGGFLFDPVSIPDSREYARILSVYRKKK